MTLPFACLPPTPCRGQISPGVIPVELSVYYCTLLAMAHFWGSRNYLTLHPFSIWTTQDTSDKKLRPEHRPRVIRCSTRITDKRTRNTEHRGQNTDSSAGSKFTSTFLSPHHLQADMPITWRRDFTLKTVRNEIQEMFGVALISFRWLTNTS